MAKAQSGRNLNDANKLNNKPKVHRSNFVLPFNALDAQYMDFSMRASSFKSSRYEFLYYYLMHADKFSKKHPVVYGLPKSNSTENTVFNLTVKEIRNLANDRFTNLKNGYTNDNSILIWLHDSYKWDVYSGYTLQDSVIKKIKNTLLTQNSYNKMIEINVNDVEATMNAVIAHNNKYRDSNGDVKEPLPKELQIKFNNYFTLRSYIRVSYGIGNSRHMYLFQDGSTPYKRINNKAIYGTTGADIDNPGPLMYLYKLASDQSYHYGSFNYIEEGYMNLVINFIDKAFQNYNSDIAGRDNKGGFILMKFKDYISTDSTVVGNQLFNILEKMHNGTKVVLKGSEFLSNSDLKKKTDDHGTQDDIGTQQNNGEGEANASTDGENYNWEKLADDAAKYNQQFQDTKRPPDDEMTQAPDRIPGPLEYMHLNEQNVDWSSALKNRAFSPHATYGVGGMPSSYLPTTDPPAWHADEAGLGTVYMNHYIRYGQYISFRPCTPRWSLTWSEIWDFVKNSANPKENSVARLFNNVTSGNIAHLESLTYEYWMHVSRLCRVAIYMMGIESDVVKYQTGEVIISEMKADYGSRAGIKYGKINDLQLGKARSDVWMNIGLAFSNIVGNKTSHDITPPSGTLTPEKLNGKVNAGARDDSGKPIGPEGATVDNDIVVFLCDGPIEVSDSVSNQTKDSVIAKAFTDWTGKSNELLKNFIQRTFASNPGEDTNLTDYLVGSYLIPKIWSESSYEKTYGAKFRFVSSAGDPVSVFFNCIYPLIKLLCLTLPEGTGGMLFQPFMVNVFSAGSVNVEYGMITNLSVKKAITTQNDMYMPTELEVDINFADMKPYLFLEKPKWWSYASQQNGSASIFLATMIGQNLATLPIGTKWNFLDQIAKINMGEQSADFWRRIELGVNRMLGRMMRDGVRTYWSLSDKLRSGKQVLQGIAGYDTFGAAIGDK